MSDFVLVSDTICELTKAEFEAHGVIPMYFWVVLDGKIYREDFGESIAPQAVYQKLREGASASTQQVQMQEYYDTFSKELKKGNDIVYICFSSALSGTYATACAVAKELMEEYPQRKISVVDSRSAAGGQRMLVLYAIALKEAGKSMEELVRILEQDRLSFCHWFLVDDLFFLHRGGRVSKKAAVMGSFIGIKPVLYVNDAGELIPYSKARGTKAALQALVKRMLELGEHLEEQSIVISHGDCLEEAERLRDMILAQTKVKDITISFLTPVIGTHSGPGTVALFFRGKQRV